MILIVTASYRNRKIAYSAGQRIDVTDAEAAHLLADAPGCFTVAVDAPPADTAINEPPADKMIRRTPRTKDTL